MEKLSRLPRLLSVFFFFIAFLLLQSCTELKFKETTDETQNVTEFLRDNEEYSLFLEMLDITNYASYMNTYGTFTVFIPTNEAINNYLKDLGFTSLTQVPIEDLKKVVKLHIMDTKYTTASFTDGKLFNPTLLGQFIITGNTVVNDESFRTLNKEAKILISNLELGNAVVHITDKVLSVADKTLAQTIEENPELSLFTEVLKATGWFEKLNQPLTFDANKEGSFLTVLVQSNEVYNNTQWTNPKTEEKLTLNTLENLKIRYSHLGDPTNAADSLNLYVQYHVIPKLNYLADFAITPVFETKAPAEVISSKLIGGKIFLNRDIFNGVLEPGFSVDRPTSDLTCSNGVLHSVDANFTIIKRLPLPVYFDLCDQPEFANNTANYRKPGGVKFGLRPGSFKDVTWWVGSGTTYTLDWAYSPTAVNGDDLRPFRFRLGTGINDLEFTTPVIIKGRYKIWVSYRQNDRANANLRVFFNNKITSRVLNMRERPNNPFDTQAGIPDNVLETQGYKRYIFPHVQNDLQYSRLVGIVEVETTGRQKIKFVSDQGSGSGANDADRFDIVEFRPVEMDQIWPKFRKGLPVPGQSNLVPKPAPGMPEN
ncbi:fasciclin domain-containing protein [Flavobacterium sp. FZUC8N2.13]|uniref:Fasciclin domain-containing protein n=1 Tax=Flavobacterium zubiriense TaxID=3138075 RepID=A0ABV4T8R9_9FLAO